MSVRNGACLSAQPRVRYQAPGAVNRSGAMTAPAGIFPQPVTCLAGPFMRQRGGQYSKVTLQGAISGAPVRCQLMLNVSNCYGTPQRIWAAALSFRRRVCGFAMIASCPRVASSTKCLQGNQSAVSYCRISALSRSGGMACTRFSGTVVRLQPATLLAQRSCHYDRRGSLCFLASGARAIGWTEPAIRHQQGGASESRSKAHPACRPQELIRYVIHEIVSTANGLQSTGQRPEFVVQRRICLDRTLVKRYYCVLPVVQVPFGDFAKKRARGSVGAARLVG
jgi:hypothetical protein